MTPETIPNDDVPVAFYIDSALEQSIRDKCALDGMDEAQSFIATILLALQERNSPWRTRQ